VDRGSILFHTEFPFRDGEVGKKFIITLNEPEGDEPYIVCKTTSNPQYKPKTPGCHAERGLFFIPGSTEFFQKDTWLQLYDLYEIECESFLQDHFRHLLEVKGKLSPAIVGQIINCIRRCPDVTDYQLSLICR
jgi:hypothetical protein